MKFVLIDLERTTETTKTYWKPKKRGYTTDIMEAGIYNLEESIKMCNDDIKGNTGMFPFEFIRF